MWIKRKPLLLLKEDKKADHLNEDNRRYHYRMGKQYTSSVVGVVKTQNYY